VEALKPILISIIRTVIMPLVAGGVFSLIAFAGVDNPSGDLVAAVTALVAMAWYLLARFLETVNPMWGVLLLIAVQPEYDFNTESDIIASVKRTVVPLLAGFIVTVIARAGFSIPDDTVVVGLQAGITTLYYGAIRLIEQRKPSAGILIGGKSSPLY
jgi:hypothetical protein